MIKQSRRKLSACFQAKVILETIKNQKMLTELSQQYEVKANSAPQKCGRRCHLLNHTADCQTQAMKTD
jgi:hypothetical protein